MLSSVVTWMFVSPPNSYVTALTNKDRGLRRWGVSGRENKTQSAETKQSSEPDLDPTQMSELSNREFKITVINMLNTLMEKVGNVK